MKLTRKAQQIIEYMLLVAAAIAGAIGIAGPNGPLKGAVERSLNRAVETIYEDYTWSTTDYSACPNPYGACTQTRNVWCKDNKGNVVDDGYCVNQGPKPPSTQDIYIPEPGGFHWWTGNVSPCSKTCGGGTQTQTVECHDSKEGKVNPTNCTGTPPPTTKDCNTQSCFQWITGTSCSGLCSAPCGSGFCAVSVTCQDTRTSEVVAATNCTGLKPSNPTIPCDTKMTCNYQWLIGDWGNCSQTCGPGQKARTVECHRISDGLKVADAECLRFLPKPEVNATCNLGPCNHWGVKGTWSECDPLCGPGTSTAIIKCYDRNGYEQLDSNCPESESGPKPSSRKDCNRGACTWSTGNYGSCSTKCGTGTKTRTVGCYAAGNPSPPLNVSLCGTAPTNPDGTAGGALTSCNPNNTSCSQTFTCFDSSSCCGNRTCNDFRPDNAYYEVCGTCSNDCGACACPNNNNPGANSTACSNTTTDVTYPPPTAWTYVNRATDCSASKCQAYCNMGSHLSSGSCVLDTTVNGSCGTANGGYYASPPTTSSELCSTGTAAGFTAGTSTYTWRCDGSGDPDGTDASCSANIATTVNGACGSANGGHYATAPSSNLCLSGTASSITSTTTSYIWSCAGAGTPIGTTASCSANIATTVNGSCGLANGGYYFSSPTSGLCTTGTATAITIGTSTYTWRCDGYGTPDGTDASCSANIATTVNGACGSANGGSYVSFPTNGLCITGTLAATTTGTLTYTWRCDGYGTPDGTDASCSANIATTVNGACGSAIGNYYNSAPTSGFCSAGNPTAVLVNIATFSWTCEGTGTPLGTSAFCSVYKVRFNGKGCGECPNGYTNILVPSSPKQGGTASRKCIPMLGYNNCYDLTTPGGINVCYANSPICAYYVKNKLGDWVISSELNWTFSRFQQPPGH